MLAEKSSGLAPAVAPPASIGNQAGIFAQNALFADLSPEIFETISGRKARKAWSLNLTSRRTTPQSGRRGIRSGADRGLSRAHAKEVFHYGQLLKAHGQAWLSACARSRRPPARCCNARGRRASFTARMRRIEVVGAFQAQSLRF